VERLLTISQVCEVLQVSPALVYKWVHYGYVPYIKIGSLVRFRESDLERWLNVKKRHGRPSLKIPVARF
jgi:PTS system nitrogen regulatory IIA component